jgi:hypothetical protein
MAEESHPEESHQKLVLPSTNDIRLEAWANAPSQGTFTDPIRPESDALATAALAIRSLAQEVLLLCARVAVLEKAVLRQDVDVDG